MKDKEIAVHLNGLTFRFSLLAFQRVRHISGYRLGDGGF